MTGVGDFPRDSLTHCKALNAGSRQLTRERLTGVARLYEDVLDLDTGVACPPNGVGAVQQAFAARS